MKHPHHFSAVPLKKSDRAVTDEADFWSGAKPGDPDHPAPTISPDPPVSSPVSGTIEISGIRAG